MMKEKERKGNKGKNKKRKYEREKKGMAYCIVSEMSVPRCITSAASNEKWRPRTNF